MKIQLFSIKLDIKETCKTENNIILLANLLFIFKIGYFSWNILVMFL